MISAQVSALCAGANFNDQVRQAAEAREQPRR
jgi:hypothetical protein